jgi:hypothetical protein
MVECISCGGRRWVTAELEKPFGRGINFRWDAVDVAKLYLHINDVAPESIYLELESKSYQYGNRVKLQKQFIARDPDSYLFRFCAAIEAILRLN